MPDPASLHRAIAEADLVVLLSSLAHLREDASLLDRYDSNAFDHGRRAATLTAAQVE
jgi:hypothetical protein